MCHLLGCWTVVLRFSNICKSYDDRGVFVIAGAASLYGPSPFCVWLPHSQVPRSPPTDLENNQSAIIYPLLDARPTPLSIEYQKPSASMRDVRAYLSTRSNHRPPEVGHYYLHVGLLYVTHYCIGRFKVLVCMHPLPHPDPRPHCCRRRFVTVSGVDK